MYQLIGEHDYVVEMAFTDAIAKVDLDRMAVDLDRLAAAHDRLRVLCHMPPDAAGWTDVGSFVHDLKLDLRFNPHVDRFALVGDARWLAWASALMKPFARGEVRSFARDEANAARKWVAA